MLPSENIQRSRELNDDPVERYECSKENVNKKRKRQNNVKNGNRGQTELDLIDLLPSKRRNIEMDEENMDEGKNAGFGSPGRNFSAFTNNHLNERSPLNAKITGTKKLVVKNFKGMYTFLVISLKILRYVNYQYCTWWYMVFCWKCIVFEGQFSTLR